MRHFPKRVKRFMKACVFFVYKDDRIPCILHVSLLFLLNHKQGNHFDIVVFCIFHNLYDSSFTK